MNFKILNPRYWFQKRESVLGSEHVRLEQMAKFNALYGCDPDKIVAAVTQFNAGTIAPLARIIEAFEQNDDKMKICSMKMKASAARCDYSIRLKEGYEDDARAKAHMETLKRFWSTIRVTNRFKMNETGGIRLLKKHMMDAQSFGYAVHEIIWKPLSNGELSAEFVKLPLWHFENHTGSLRFLKREHDYEGEIMRDGEWLVTSGDGVGIAASICAMAKHLSFQDWLLFSERSGMPIIHGATTAAFGSDQWNNLKAALRSIGRDCRIQTDAETKIELVGSASATNIPYPALVDWADRAIAGLYRGADLSTISKGDGTGASLQGDESAMLEQDACALMGETLHEQIDRFVIRYVYGEEPLAYISIDPVEKPDVDTDIKVDNHLAGLGVKLSKKEALQRYGRAEADDEDDALELQKETPFKPDGIGFANEKREIGNREEGTGKSILDAFSKDSSPVAEAIKELLNDPSKEKAEELLKKLPALLPEDPAMAAVIAEAMAAEFGKERLPNAGTSEGAKKGWLTRKKNGWTPTQLADNRKTVRSLADEALTDRQLNRTEKLGTAGGQEVDDIKAAIGIDVTGFEHQISSKDIRHADIRHGQPRMKGKRKVGERDKKQIPLTGDDFEKIPDLYADYDRIEKGSPEENTGYPSIRYIKEFPDGMLYGVDVVIEKDKIMRYKTGWKKKL